MSGGQPSPTAGPTAATRAPAPALILIPHGNVFFPAAGSGGGAPGVQSPFMYASFRASPTKPAYMGFGAQANRTAAPMTGAPIKRSTAPTISVQQQSVGRPRAGGVYNGEVWTGGSAIFPTGRPIALNCFRPKDLRERLKIQDNLVMGLPDDMKLDMPSDTDKSSHSITRSIGELKLELERCGLDNPFCIVLSPTQEIYLLENWGGITISDVKYWCDQLDQTGCEFNAENLRLSSMKIKASFGSALSSRVASVTEADTPGPVLFKVAVDHVASLSAAKVCKLTTDLQGLTLKSVAGQSVPLVTKTVTELARQIDFSDVGPADLTALVAKVYTTGTDTGFNHRAWGVYNSISTGFDSRPWREIVEGLVSFYEQQIQLDLYVPALGKKDSDQTLHGLLSDNTSNGDRSAAPLPRGNKGTDTCKCYKCGATGHLSKECPNQKDLDPAHIPPNTKKGDSRERTRNGTAERWCLWTTGATAHLTKNHPKPPESNLILTVTQAVPAAEANLGIINTPFHFGFLSMICTEAKPATVMHPKVNDGESTA